MFRRTQYIRYLRRCDLLKEPGTCSINPGQNRTSLFQNEEYLAKLYSPAALLLCFLFPLVFQKSLVEIFKNQKHLTHFSSSSYLSFPHFSKKGELQTQLIMSAKKSLFQWSSLKPLWANLSRPKVFKLCLRGLERFAKVFPSQIKKKSITSYKSLESIIKEQHSQIYKVIDLMGSF